MAVTYSTSTSSSSVPDGTDNIITNTVTLSVTFDSIPMLKGVDVFTPKYQPYPGAGTRVLTPAGYACFSSIGKSDVIGTHYGVYGKSNDHVLSLLQTDQSSLIYGIHGSRGSPPTIGGMYVYGGGLYTAVSINGAGGLDYTTTQFLIEFDPYILATVDGIFYPTPGSGYINIAIPLPSSFKSDISSLGRIAPTHAIITITIGFQHPTTGSEYSCLHFVNYDTTTPGTGWITVKDPFDIAAGNVSFCSGNDVYSVTPRSRTPDSTHAGGVYCVNSNTSVSVPYFYFTQTDSGLGYYGDITDYTNWYDSHGNLISSTPSTISGTFLGTASSRPIYAQDISVYSGTLTLTPPAGAAWFTGLNSAGGAFGFHHGWCDRPTITIDGNWLPGVLPKIN